MTGLMSSLSTSSLTSALSGPLSSGGGGPSPYVAKAVHFDGSAWLSIASLLASGDNTGYLSSSKWFKLSAPGFAAAGALWVVDPEDTFTNEETVTSIPHNVWEGFFGNANNSLTLGTGDPINAGIITTDVWHNILISVQANHPAGEKVLQVYLDDVAYVFTVADDLDAFLMTYNNLPFFVGADTFGDNWLGDLSDLWIAPGTFIDFSVEANRRLFISATGKPVDPSGFPASAVLFSGDSSTFPVNQGTGGAFTLTGSLTDASSSPSD